MKEPKAPNKPSKPYKPHPPDKTIEVYETIDRIALEHGYSHQPYTLTEFLTMINARLTPKDQKVEDVQIRVEVSHTPTYYDDYITEVELIVEGKVIRDNPCYAERLKDYKAKMKRLPEREAAYKEKLKAYKLAMKEYEVKKAEYDIWWQGEMIKSLEQRLVKMKAEETKQVKVKKSAK